MDILKKEQVSKKEGISWYDTYCSWVLALGVTFISHVKICSSSNGLNGIQRRNIEKPTQSKNNNVMSDGEIMK